MTLNILPWAEIAQVSQILSTCDGHDCSAAFTMLRKMSDGVPVCRMLPKMLHAPQAGSCAAQHQHTDTWAGAN